MSMKSYKVFVYKGIVWMFTDGEGYFYDKVPAADYLCVSKEDKDLCNKIVDTYFDECMNEINQNNINKSCLREMKVFRMHPLLMRLTNSEVIVFLDNNVISNLNCKRLSFRIYESGDLIKNHSVSQNEKNYMQSIKDNVEPFLLSRANMTSWFEKYGIYTMNENTHVNLQHRIRRDLNDFYSNGIIFLEQFLNLDDHFLQDVIKKSSWINVRDRLKEEYPYL